jgi:hypothetical protein
MSTNGPFATADSVTRAAVYAGTRGHGEYRCCECGYGIVTHGVVPLCPMCNAGQWQPASRRDGHRRSSVIVKRDHLRAAGAATSSFSSAVTAASDCFASPNSMLVLGSLKSGLSTPA